MYYLALFIVAMQRILLDLDDTLDRMLDFCGDDAVLGLFKDVCRHYFNIYPAMIANQVNLYREIWDTE